MSKAICILFSVVLFCSSMSLYAQNPAFSDYFSVVPWNGHSGAVSLTFDDGDNCHFQTTGPILDRYGIKGTFFLIGTKINNVPEWKKLFRNGHELGNHSLNHMQPKDLENSVLTNEVYGSQEKQEKLLGGKVVTYAYPFTATTPHLKKLVMMDHIAARGGHGDNFYMTFDSVPDWANIPSRGGQDWKEFVKWVDEARDKKAWTVFLFHNVGNESGWQPITEKCLIKIAKQMNKNDMWGATFAGVSAYIQSQDILSACTAEEKDGARVFTWTLEDKFPDNIEVLLSMKEGSGLKVFQEDTEITPDDNGHYKINLSKLSLTVKPE